MNSRLIVTLSLYLILNTFFILIIGSSNFIKQPKIPIKENLWQNMNSIEQFTDYIKTLNSKSNLISFKIANFDGGTELTIPNKELFLYSEGNKIEIQNKYKNLIVSIMDSIKNKYRGFSINIKLLYDKNFEKKLFLLEQLLQPYKSSVIISISAGQYKNDDVNINIERK